MNKKWCAAFVAMVLAAVAYAAEFPSYLRTRGTKVTGYRGDMPADLVIPEGITAIGEDAFNGCRTLRSVTIPDSVTKIDDDAFNSCTGLTSVVIGNGVKTIGEDAFEHCTSLASVVIGNGVTKIDGDAFNGCTSLTSMTMGSGVKTIGSGAFSKCVLREVLFGGTMAQWKELHKNSNIQATVVRCSDGNIGIEEVPAYLEMRGSVIVGHTDDVPADLVIPDGVTEIGMNAFSRCKSLTSVSIPNSVTEINNSAFYYCRLKEIRFGGTKAQWQALLGSGSIAVTLVRCSDGNIGVEKVPAYLEMSGSVIVGHTGDVPADLVIPDGVTKIGMDAFRDCGSLVSVTIPDSVTEISSSAFSKSFFFGKEVLLQEIRFGGTRAQWKALSGSDTIRVTLVRCSDGNIGIEGIPAYFKMNGSEIVGYTGKVPAHLVIPESVTKIGANAFKGCLDLESVTIPGSVNVTEARESFAECTYLERVVLGNGMTAIPNAMFSGCASLTSVTIPESVTAIGRSAFAGCVLLKSITIPRNVRTFGQEVFMNCTSLASMTIPDGMKNIPSGAFNRCSSLASVTIPDSVTEIGGSAFYGCSLLTNMTIPNNVTQIGKDAFKGCSSLKSINIPHGVSKIEQGTFENCTSLTSVTIPRSLVGIGASAFSWCTSLASISLPLNVREIGTRAFGSLKEVRYGGTKTQWNAIKKVNIGSFTVHCTDGDITVK